MQLPLPPPLSFTRVARNIGFPRNYHRYCDPRDIFYHREDDGLCSSHALSRHKSYGSSKRARTARAREFLRAIPSREVDKVLDGRPSLYRDRLGKYKPRANSNQAKYQGATVIPPRFLSSTTRAIKKRTRFTDSPAPL